MPVVADAASLPFATVYNYEDYIWGTDSYTGGDIYKVSLPYDSDNLFWQTYANGSYLGGYYGNPLRIDPMVSNTKYMINCWPWGWYDLSDSPSTPGAIRVLTLYNVPNGSNLSFKVRLLSVAQLSATFSWTLYVRYFDDAGNPLTLRTYSGTDTYAQTASSFIVTFDFPIEKPEGATYMVFSIKWSDLNAQFDSGSFSAVLTSLDLYIDINDLQALVQETQQTNRLLEDIKGIIESEKDEASSGGSSSVGDLADVIPDYSSGFLDAVQNLASSMSYDGTSAAFTTPAVVVPAIGDLVQEFRMLDPMVVDFEVYVSMMPDNVLLLVQSLFTIALIVYCFKEFYDTIAYVLTLKGGGV